MVSVECGVESAPTLLEKVLILSLLRVAWDVRSPENGPSEVCALLVSCGPVCSAQPNRCLRTHAAHQQNRAPAKKQIYLQYFVH